MYDIYNIDFVDAPRSYKEGARDIYKIQLGNLFSDKDIEDPKPYDHDGEIIISYNLDPHVGASLALNVEGGWYDSTVSGDLPMISKYIKNWEEFLKDFSEKCEIELEEELY